MEISIEKINEVIEKEMSYARAINMPLMVAGMGQIKMLLNTVNTELAVKAEELKESHCKGCSNYNIGDGIDDINECDNCRFA